MQPTNGADSMVTTLYDEAAYTALVNLMMNKLRRWPRIVLLATGLVSAVGSGMMMLAYGQASPALFGVMMLGSMMCMLGFLAPRFAVRMMMAGNRKGETPQNTYLFSDAGITVRTKDNQREYTYDYVSRMLEMSGYLFMFMKDGQVFLLKQTDVKSGYRRLHDDLERRLTAARLG